MVTEGVDELYVSETVALPSPHFASDHISLYAQLQVCVCVCVCV